MKYFFGYKENPANPSVH